MEKGVTFRSDTDTEVLVQLIEYIQMKKNLDLLTAVQLALCIRWPKYWSFSVSLCSESSGLISFRID